MIMHTNDMHIYMPRQTDMYECMFVHVRIIMYKRVCMHECMCMYVSSRSG